MFEHDEVTEAEIYKAFEELQERGLSAEGAKAAIDRKLKGLSGRVVLMQDGEEVAASDFEFEVVEAEEEEKAEDEEPEESERREN